MIGEDEVSKSTQGWEIYDTGVSLGKHEQSEGDRLLPDPLCLLERIKRKVVGEEVTGVGVMKDEELRLEEIESSHTLGGYGRCRYYSVVRYTIVNRSLRLMTLQL